MLETVLVLAGVALLALLGLALPVLPAAWWIQTGALCTAAGLVLGVPTGLVYHVALARALRGGDGLPARWWLRPVALHPRLREADRLRVLPWFWAGGAGFLLCALGCALVVLGVVVEGLRAGVL